MIKLKPLQSFFIFIAYFLVLIFLAEPQFIHYNVAGSYSPITNNIMIYPDKATDLDDYLNTATHEYGHYIFDELFNDSQRKEWIEEYNNFDYHITTYAKTNYQEGFAENYKMYKVHNYTPYSVRVMLKIIGE